MKTARPKLPRARRISPFRSRSRKLAGIEDAFREAEPPRVSHHDMKVVPMGFPWTVLARACSKTANLSWCGLCFFRADLAMKRLSHPWKAIAKATKQLCLLGLSAIPAACPLAGAFESGPCGNQVQYPVVIVTDSVTGAVVCNATVVAVPAYGDGGSYYADDPVADGGWLASIDGGVVDINAVSPQEGASTLPEVTGTASTSCVYTGANLGSNFGFSQPSSVSYVILIASPGYLPTFVTASVIATMLSGCAPNDQVTALPPIRVALTKA